MVVINGKINIREGADPKLIVNEVLSLEEARKKFTRNLVLSFETAQISSELVDEVKILLNENRGDVPVYLNIKTPDNGAYVLKSRSIKIKPSLALIESLRDKVGRQNVWVGG